MKRAKTRRGFTLIELMFGVIISVLVVLVMTRTFSATMKFFLRNSVRNQLTTDSRIATQTMIPILQRALGSTMWVCTCGGPCTTACVPPPGVPLNSGVLFNTNDSTSGFAVALSTYNFYWSNGTVQMVAQTPASTIGPRTLASNVTELSFSWSANDPSIIKLTLNLQAAAGGTAVESVLLPEILINMTGTP